MVTRKVLVVKKWSFSAQNGDEKGSRRQKIEFSAENGDENGLRRQKREFSGSKWRREKVSSSKKGVSRLKMATRMGFVTQKRSLPAENGDEKGSRRQKMEFLGSKW
ncbi:hypothetical protein [Caldibacillus thermoamylovorans]|uniref:hypothetical protein n=1 Tax=Caldibacillus thermoamylovorans TaxID=35841 RepID=UPI000B241D34|nr:hypothetical protein [Caldibacillus thermoamylovorans]